MFALLAVATLTATAVGGRGRVVSSPSEPVAVPAPGTGAVSGGDGLAAGIAKLQATLQGNPDDARALAQLAAAYVQQARITSDPSAYTRAEQAVQRSLSVAPQGNADAHTAYGALRAARHDFAGALTEAQAALAINPYSSTATGVQVDALTELGRYDEAQAAAQHMLDLRPNIASLSRASYQLELRGDTTRAREALLRALDDATSPADKAFVHYYLGELAFNAGDLATAGEQYGAGRAADPTSMPLLEGQAKLEAARGDGDAAARDYAEVTQRLPAPQYLIEYADLLRSLGRRAEADAQEAVLDAQLALFRSNGVSVDLELALHLADRGQPAGALAAAEAEYGRRKAVVVADALAWALHVSGRDAEALAKATEATRLGGAGALAFFHRGMIEKSLGQLPAAKADLTKALAVNPHFSPLQVPVARAALAELR